MKKNNGAYKVYVGYTVGSAGTAMKLDRGVPYTIVVYSYGLKTLPVFLDVEKAGLGVE